LPSSNHQLGSKASDPEKKKFEEKKTSDKRMLSVNHIQKCFEFEKAEKHVGGPHYVEMST